MAENMWADLALLERKAEATRTRSTQRKSAKAGKPKFDTIPANAREFLVGLLEAKNDTIEANNGTRPYAFLGVKGKYVFARRGQRQKPTLFHLNHARTKLVVSKLHRATATGEIVRK